MEEARALWAPFAQKYKIHEETYALQARLIEVEAVPYDGIGLDGARELAFKRAQAVQGTMDFCGDQTEITIPSPYDPDGIQVSVYKPEARPENPPILVHYHGGGLVVGSRLCNSTPLKVIATESGAIVVNADYRLLPNTAAPCAPFEDGVLVARWVMANKTLLGGTESSKVGLCGDSSGGHIVACVTNEVLDLDFQILIYPVADTTLSQESIKEFAEVPILSEKALKWIFKHSMDRIPNHANDPRYNPMARTNTESSPPALIVLAELDPLVGCGLDYAEKLRTAGVPVQCEVIRGVPHGVFSSGEYTKTKSAEVYTIIANFIKTF